jgi:hypothetical protein
MRENLVMLAIKMTSLHSLVYSLFFDRVKRDSATVAIVSDKMSKERMT